MSRREHETDTEPVIAASGAAPELHEQELYVEPAQMARRDTIGVVVALLALALIGAAGYVWLNPNLDFGTLRLAGRPAAPPPVVAAADHPEHVECPYCGMYADRSHGAVAVMWVGGGSNTLDSFDCVFNYIKENNVRLESGTVRSYDEPGGAKWIDLKQAVYLYDTTVTIEGSMPPYVAAFSTREQAETAKASLGGEIVDFAGLQAKWI
jgi:nitrous oxide reductase accessory protein NosL